ncbi:MAG: recombinase family protein [Dehalococcoidales bacterium]|nr:recombinase family protein [Dehalococcoidales bacterium]
MLRIFNGILEGKGLIEIAKQLNREGTASPRGKGWIKTTIRKILINEAYTGTMVWGRASIRDLPVIRVDNAWPAIIDRDTFDQVQILLKNRAPVILHPKRVASRYLLSGLARCGHCGKALVGQDAKSGRFTYYVCGTLLKKGAGSCPTRYLNSQQFENLVIGKIKEHVLTTDNLTKLVHMINEEMDGLAIEYSERLHIITVETADVDHRLERLYDALETGQIQLADLAPRIQQLRHRHDQLQAARLELEQHLSDRRVELADKETVACYVSDLHNLLSESSLAEKKSFVRSFVKEVKVTGDSVLLTYTIPMLPTGMTEEKLPVLSIVHYGGPLWTRTTDPSLMSIDIFHFQPTKNNLQ